MCKITQTRIGEKNVKFNLTIAEDIPYELIGDKAKVKGIINNLLTNSIKYTEEGTIDLNIRCINDLVNNTGSMAKTADNINDKLNVMEDDLKYLRDFAEREIINNHITSDVNVEMINNNNISSELDIDGVLNSLTRKLDEQLRIQANGIYNY